MNIKTNWMNIKTKLTKINNKFKLSNTDKVKLIYI